MFKNYLFLELANLYKSELVNRVRDYDYDQNAPTLSSPKVPIPF